MAFIPNYDNLLTGEPRFLWVTDNIMERSATAPLKISLLRQTKGTYFPFSRTVLPPSLRKPLGVKVCFITFRMHSSGIHQMHFRVFSTFLFLWVKMKGFIMGPDHMVEKIDCKVIREHRGLTSE